jgi:PAS domain S-box-containing protein
MEEALRENETRLRAITDSAHDAILMMDPQGLVSYWNLAAERILGFTSAEAIGQTLHELIVPEHYHAAHHAAFPTFQRTGQGAAVGKTIEVNARRKDGTIIAIQLSLSSLFLNGGWYAVGIISDITERKRMQEALQTTLIDLEQTNQSLVDQTLRANEMTVAAEYANAAKSEFLANMSHEIRTPMNGVIGMTGLLLDTDLTPEQRQFTNIIRSSSETLLSLINDILDFSKIEAKKMDLESIDFDLRLTLEDTMEMLSVKAHEKGLEIAGILDPDIPAYVRGDPGRVRQIITNLGNNAIKFTPRGEISLRANLESQDEKQVCVRFAITDTGIGIPQDKMARLFTPFSQVDGSVTRKYGGTGLGLAISKQLAELMGGSTGVTSEEGIGSTFWFTVVFEKTSDEKIRNLVPLANLTGIKVLVVDDHEVNRLLVSLLLKSWGCRYAEAEKGDVALSLLQEAASSGDPYQAALLDMQMPDMDGAELARRIKADPRLGATQLILFTSLGKRGDAAQMKALGFSGYLTKPLRQEQLHECLALVLGQATISTTQNTHQTAPTELVTRHTIADSFKHKTHILLAEDNTVNQFVVTKILKKLGYRADVVANGQEAITALQAINYDLILMDCQMPEMDGFEATRLIRDPQTGVLNPLVPIVALTANALTGDRERCLKAGMDDYLSKPINVDDLNVALEKWLAKAETEKTAENQTQSQRISETDNTTSNEPQANEGDETSIFNEAELVQRLMDDQDLVEAVVIAFVEDMPLQITALKQFLASGDISGAQRQAHTIKGASANLGASRLRQVAFELEKLAKNSDIPEAEIVSNISKRMPEIETAFEQLKQVLKRIYSI